MITTGYELHREMCRRGLELRRTNGRDDALLRSLAVKLTLPVAGFSAGLKNSKLSAEDYLRHFLKVVQPFARMYSEIWYYLAQQKMPAANETIRLRFGFPDDPQAEDVDLEQFRVWEATAGEVFGLAVPEVPNTDLLNELLLGRTCRETYARLMEQVKSPTHPRYEHGSRILVPSVWVERDEDAFGSVVSSILQATADWVAEKWHKKIDFEREYDGARLLNAPSELRSEVLLIRERAAVLHDAIPTWHDVLDQWHSLPGQPRRDVFQCYDHNFRPRLDPYICRKPVSVLQAIQALDLPFWRHRWHTYEIWISVVVLRTLRDFEPILFIKAGRTALDSPSHAVVAQFKSYPPAYLHVQAEMTLPPPGARKIRPDLEVCLSQTPVPGDTVMIVECKQRRSLDRAHVEEVTKAYTRGVRDSGGVMLVNYDECAPDLLAAAANGSQLLGEVHPGNAHGLALFQKEIRSKLRDSLDPQVGKCILFDISESMGPHYGESNLLPFVSELQQKSVRTYSFNEKLHVGLKLSTSGRAITSGETSICRALVGLVTHDIWHGPPRRLLIVSDGEFGSETPDLSDFPECRIYLPEELVEGLRWLIAEEPDPS